MQRIRKNCWTVVAITVVVHSLSTACVTGRIDARERSGSDNPRLYWKVYPKSDNTFYILPRPELTTTLSTPSEMNNLRKDQAEQMAGKLNAGLQFSVQVSNEAGSRMVRVSPEPLIEDIIDACKTQRRHPFLEGRCKKELAWAAKGERPDIYLQFDDCEAVAFASALNRIYGKVMPSTNLCPAWHQVEK